MKNALRSSANTNSSKKKRNRRVSFSSTTEVVAIKRTARPSLSDAALSMLSKCAAERPAPMSLAQLDENLAADSFNDSEEKTVNLTATLSTLPPAFPQLHQLLSEFGSFSSAPPAPTPAPAPAPVAVLRTVRAAEQGDDTMDDMELTQAAGLVRSPTSAFPSITTLLRDLGAANADDEQEATTEPSPQPQQDSATNYDDEDDDEPAPQMARSTSLLDRPHTLDTYEADIVSELLSESSTSTATAPGVPVLLPFSPLALSDSHSRTIMSVAPSSSTPILSDVGTTLAPPSSASAPSSASSAGSVSDRHVPQAAASPATSDMSMSMSLTFSRTQLDLLSDAPALGSPIGAPAELVTTETFTLTQPVLVDARENDTPCIDSEAPATDGGANATNNTDTLTLTMAPSPKRSLLSRPSLAPFHDLLAWDPASNSPSAAAAARQSLSIFDLEAAAAAEDSTANIMGNAEAADTGSIMNGADSTNLIQSMLREATTATATTTTTTTTDPIMSDMMADDEHGAEPQPEIGDATNVMNEMMREELETHDQPADTGDTANLIRDMIEESSSSVEPAANEMLDTDPMMHDASNDTANMMELAAAPDLLPLASPSLSISMSMSITLQPVSQTLESAMLETTGPLASSASVDLTNERSLASSADIAIAADTADTISPADEPEVAMPCAVDASNDNHNDNNDDDDSDNALNNTQDMIKMLNGSLTMPFAAAATRDSNAASSIPAIIIQESSPVVSSDTVPQVQYQQPQPHQELQPPPPESHDEALDEDRNDLGTAGTSTESSNKSARRISVGDDTFFQLAISPDQGRGRRRSSGAAVGATGVSEDDCTDDIFTSDVGAVLGHNDDITRMLAAARSMLSGVMPASIAPNAVEHQSKRPRTALATTVATAATVASSANRQSLSHTSNLLELMRAYSPAAAVRAARKLAENQQAAAGSPLVPSTTTSTTTTTTSISISNAPEHMASEIEMPHARNSTSSNTSSSSNDYDEDHPGDTFDFIAKLAPTQRAVEDDDEAFLLHSKDVVIADTPSYTGPHSTNGSFSGNTSSLEYEHTELGLPRVGVPPQSPLPSSLDVQQAQPEQQEPATNTTASSEAPLAEEPLEAASRLSLTGTNLLRSRIRSQVASRKSLAAAGSGTASIAQQLGTTTPAFSRPPVPRSLRAIATTPQPLFGFEAAQATRSLLVAAATVATPSASCGMPSSFALPSVVQAAPTKAAPTEMATLPSLPSLPPSVVEPDHRVLQPLAELEARTIELQETCQVLENLNEWVLTRVSPTELKIAFPAAQMHLELSLGERSLDAEGKQRSRITGARLTPFGSHTVVCRTNRPARCDTWILCTDLERYDTVASGVARGLATAFDGAVDRVVGAVGNVVAAACGAPRTRARCRVRVHSCIGSAQRHVPDTSRTWRCLDPSRVR